MFNNGNSGLTASDVLALTNNENGFGGNGSWIWLIVILAIFGGWGGYGFGGFGGGQGGVRDAYILNSDFSTLSRQMSDGFNSVDNALDRQNAGICDLGYTSLNLANQTNMAIMQGNNALATQLADCCCKTQSGIERVNTNNAMNTATITSAIKDCCCDSEKIAMQAEYNAQARNCQTLQAIDKVGDRIIDYLNADKAQTLRDENQALRLQASQSCQNQYLINALRPTPIPAFNVGYNPYNYGFGFGTTIA